MQPQPCLGCLPVTAAADVPERLGLSAHVVRRLIGDGILVRLRRGVVAGSCLCERAAADPAFARELALRALLVTYDDAFAGHESAALVVGLPLLDPPAWPIALRPGGAWRGGDSSRVRVARLPAHHRAESYGIRHTSVARTVVDIARSSTFRQAVVVGDAALRRGCSDAELQTTLAECAQWSDVGKARRALAFFDARSESPLESVSRAIMHEYAVPPPEPQFEITVGGEHYRVDFYWKDQRTIGEADGQAKYSLDPDLTPAQVAWREKLREDALRDAGYGVVRWTFPQMLGRTDETIARIMRRLAA